MAKTLSDSISGPSAAPASDVERRFQTLAETWTRETAHLSSTRQMAEHAAYREIRSLGQPVVPLIFRQLVRAPDFRWFHALRDIIGSGPEIPAEARGRLKPVTECWLRWGKEHGIAW